MNTFDMMYYSFFGLFFVFYFGFLVFFFYLVRKMESTRTKDYITFFVFSFFVPFIGPIVYYILKKNNVFSNNQSKNRIYEKFTPYKGENK